MWPARGAMSVSKDRATGCSWRRRTGSTRFSWTSSPWRSPLTIRWSGLDDGNAVRAVAGRDGGRRPEGPAVDDRQRARSLVGYVDCVAGGPYCERVRAVCPEGEGGGDPTGPGVDGCDPARTEAGDVGAVAVGTHRH